MEARIDRIEQEIAALEERKLLLTANLNRTPFEEAELSLLPAKLDDRRLYRQTLATALATAQTQGTKLTQR